MCDTDACFFQDSSFLGWEWKVLPETQETVSTKLLEMKGLAAVSPNTSSHTEHDSGYLNLESA